MTGVQTCALPIYLVALIVIAALIAGVVLFNIYGEQICPEIYQYLRIR